VKKQITVFLCVIHCFVAIYAQGEIDVQPRVFYRNEWSLAIMLYSNGWGGNYRYGKRIDAAKKHLFEIDFAYMKHPKEAKSYSALETGTRYVEGKKNLAFNFRFAYGRQNEIFRKHDVGGVAIRYFYNFGPALALLKPIYYNIADLVPIPSDPTMAYVVYRSEPEKYNSNWHNENVRIGSRASFFKGFGGLKPVPGAFGKFGINVEYSKQDRIIHALEAGVIAEGFVKKLEIMDFGNPPSPSAKIAKNQQLFITLFVSYRFGRIVDPYEIKKKREQSKEISY
jgi:hypothetical protein